MLLVDVTDNKVCVGNRMVIELKYGNTHTYLIKGNNGYILFDTAWAGTFSEFCRELGRLKISIQDIRYILISHFHPDHMGIASDIASNGATIVVFECQREYVHWADHIFAKDSRIEFTPIDDSKIRVLHENQGKDILAELGIEGEIIHTPGHSDDSISLYLHSGELLVGDLNPLYELELHKGNEIYKSWQKLLAMKPAVVYYGHAKKCVLDKNDMNKCVLDKNDMNKCMLKDASDNQADERVYELVGKIMNYVDKGRSVDSICKKTKAKKEFVEDVTRMYLTHKDVGVQGILDRIEIKGM